MDLGVERVLLVRDAFGDVRALRNSCPHVPHALIDARRGRLEEDDIACPTHGLRFASDGRCIAGECADLTPLQVRTEGGFFWVRTSDAIREEGDDETPKGADASREEIFRVEQAVLHELPDLEIRANWKLIAEQWLDALEVRSDVGTALGSAVLDGSVAPVRSGWSAAHYRSLAKSAWDEPWRLRFVAPNQLIERRPDGLSVLQIVATGPGRCRVRRLHLGRAGDGAMALRYLAGRLAPWCRRSNIAVAESAQQGLSEFGYRAAGGSASAGVGWLRTYLSAHVPALAAERPPNEPRQMNYNLPSA